MDLCMARYPKAGKIKQDLSCIMLITDTIIFTRQWH